MQSFDAQIKQFTFSFLRVTYGKGDLWYHISYEGEDKRVTFRMTTQNGTWKIYDTEDPALLEIEAELAKEIAAFESIEPNAVSKEDNIKKAPSAKVL